MDYQHEIGLRNTRAKKNQTDNAHAVEHIPLRYFLAFVGPVLVTPRDFLARKGHSQHDVDRTHAAWTKRPCCCTSPSGPGPTWTLMIW